MRKISTIIALLFCVSSLSAQINLLYTNIYREYQEGETIKILFFKNQSAGWVFHRYSKYFTSTYGVGGAYLKYSGPVPIGNGKYQYGSEKAWGIAEMTSIGFDLPLIRMPEIRTSIGINPQIQIAEFQAGSEYFPFKNFIDGAIYGTFRFGNRSSPKDQEGYGFGMGFGKSYRVFPYFKESTSAFFEFTKKFWFIRIYGDLQPNQFYNYYSSEGLASAISIRQFGLVWGTKLLGVSIEQK